MIDSNDNHEELKQCPWCSSSTQYSWGENKSGFQSVTCGDCGLIYVKNRYNEKGLEQYYRNYLSNVHQESEQAVLDRSTMYQIEYKHITQYISRGAVLDVGCSGGYFLDCFDDNYQCTGVEFGAEAALEAEKKYKVYQGEFDKIQIEQKFDLIVFRGVIEHIPFPKLYLDKATSILNEGGCIYITSTPNSDAFCCDLFKEHWNQHVPESHLMHFSSKHFNDYFNEIGMTCIDTKSFYRETPYCNIEEDIVKVADAIKIKNTGQKVGFKSPAFYENMMSLIYK